MDLKDFMDKGAVGLLFFVLISTFGLLGMMIRALLTHLRTLDTKLDRNTEALLELVGLIRGLRDGGRGS